MDRRLPTLGERKRGEKWEWRKGVLGFGPKQRGSERGVPKVWGGESEESSPYSRGGVGGGVSKFGTVIANEQRQNAKERGNRHSAPA